MAKELLKKIGIYAGILLLFVGIAYSFVPEVLEGKIVDQHDISGWKGMAHEALEHNKANPDDPTAWTNSMFGGMPTTAITDNFEGDWTKSIYDGLMWGKRPATYLFIALLGGFLLMLSLGVRKIIAVAGAIAMAFCSYNFQIIQVGHNTKMQAIAFMPWVLAGVIFTLRAALEWTKEQVLETTWKSWLPKTVLGATLFALALSMQIKANHIQITYYLAIVIAFMAIGALIYLCIMRRDLLKRFFAASGLLLVVGILGIATNANKLIPTYEYSAFTMRGGSELSAKSETHNSEGLDLEYATQWSYGIEEMPNLMIPNYNGGSSNGPLKVDSATGELLKEYGYKGKYLEGTLKNLPLYWGPQPFTAGPMYMGAITVFLFVLGAFLCKGREKWWLIAASVVAIFLAWGSHFMWFTELWFEYAPFYNKFRTVSMALVVLQITMPMLGFLALDRILKQDYNQKELLRKGLIAFALTGGICLLGAITPNLFGDFSANFDKDMNRELAQALRSDRADLLQADAFRSFVMIALAAVLIFWAFKRTFKSIDIADREKVVTIASIVMAVLVLFDMWSVGKRYLNEEHFVTKEKFDQVYNKRKADTTLLQDKDPNFRVLDLSENTFNSSLTSYHHKSIGGYSPVKLQRYQDLIDRYISSEINIIINAYNSAETYQDFYEGLSEAQITSLLNGKYIITSGNAQPIGNPYAFGNCWFVDSFVPAETPDDEIALLGEVDLRNTAVIGKDFEKVYGFFAGAQNDTSSEVDNTLVTSSDVETSPDRITLTHYAPNELRYSYKTSSARPAIFSEIYYPKGWKAWIEPAGAYGKVVDGHYHPTAGAKELELFRADWILRGAIVPEGEGTIVMRFEPESYVVGENISMASSITLLLMLLLSIAGLFVMRK